MITTSQFKNGTHIEVDGQVFRILEFQHVKPGKGQAFVRSKLRSLATGAVLDKTFRAGEKVRSIHTETRKMQYLYESGDEAVLMDLGDYEQISLPKAVAGDALDWIQPNDEVDVLFVDGKPSDLQVPSAIEMGVVETEPGLRGDTASGGGNKPAKLESGVTVQVPLFVNPGDRVRVDTRSREYISRV
jgi:elongation factor P